MINLIWDIDGTLLNTRGLGATPFCQAFTEYTGKSAVIDKKKLSGFTDFEIALSLMRDAGIKEDIELAEKILLLFSVQLEKTLLKNPPEVLGDVMETLKFTNRSSQFVNSIGTGNCRNGAIIKLKSAGIYEYFQKSNFHVATTELWNRDAIIESASKSGTYSLSLVIGDSPRDISAAHNSNMPVLAIPTGQHSFEELSNLNPELILERNWSLSEFRILIQNFLSRRNQFGIPIN